MLLGNSVVAVLCRLGLTIGDSVTEIHSFIAMGMIGSPNKRAQLVLRSSEAR